MDLKIDTYAANGALISSVDTRNLDDVKAAKWAEINTYRDVVLSFGVWYMGYLWGSDPASRANITGAVAGATAGVPLPPNFTWRDNNNNNVPFTLTNLITLGGYVLGYVNEVYNASWTMKATVDTLTTTDAVDAVVVPLQAWPTNNMDGSMPVANTTA